MGNTTYGKRRVTQTIHYHNYTLMERKFIRKVPTHFNYQQNDLISYVAQSFLQTVEIQAISESKIFFVYTP